jgi:sugar/nucleoside kinase (ribokinase family)
VIVVLGRPALSRSGALDGTAAGIALTALHSGGDVELVGSVGDDPDGDSVVTLLGSLGIGHAAVLRDPAGVTPRSVDGAEDAHAPLPRLDAADIDLGLKYIAECQVLVVADALDPAALAVAADAASYHRAALVVLTNEGAEAPRDMPDEATLLEVPTEDGGAFAELVGRYAAALDSGRGAADAWQDALDETGWEPAEE